MCYVFMTSQVGQFHSRTSQEVIMTSQVGQFHLGNSWYFTMTSQIGRFYWGAIEMSWQRSEEVRLINVPVVTSW